MCGVCQFSFDGMYGKKTLSVPEVGFYCLHDQFASIPMHGFSAVISLLTTGITCDLELCHPFKILLLLIRLMV